MEIFIKWADLVGDPETQKKFISYKGKKYELKETDWDKAEQEAKELLKKLYPNEIIHIG